MYITGTLLIPNEDYLTSVSAVEIDVNGSSFNISYIDSSGNLKAAATSVSTTSGVNNAMSNCSIVQ